MWTIASVPEAPVVTVPILTVQESPFIPLGRVNANTAFVVSPVLITDGFPESIIVVGPKATLADFPSIPYLNILPVIISSELLSWLDNGTIIKELGKSAT